MCVEHRNLLWTLMLLFLSGAFCNTEWGVEYQTLDICAVTGSSVVIPCTFYYPEKEIVRVMWAHGSSHSFDGPFIFDSNINNTSKFEYIGDKKKNCSFKIHQVEHSDRGKYTFRFITDSPDGKWTGKLGSTLKVVDLHISVTKPDDNGIMKDGDSVNLTCNGCKSSYLSSAFSWFKNGKSLINEGPVIHFNNISSTNSGNYTCSLKSETATTSGVINIDVEYGPTNTTVSVRPSTDVDVGTNITLMCSSHAHPPVENYTWFRIDDEDGVLAVGHRVFFFSADVGQYFCRATNRHGSQNSSALTITIKTYWPTLARDVLISSTVLVSLLLLVIPVIAIRRINTERASAPAAECEEDTQNTDYVNWPHFDDNQSQEGTLCEGGTVEITYATVDFYTKRKPKMGQQMDSYHNDQHHNDDNVIYSTLYS